MNPNDFSGSDDAPAPRRPRRRTVLLTVAAVLVVWSAVGVVHLLQARSLALSGLAGLEDVRSRVDVDAVTEGDLVGPLVDAWDDFTTARERIRSPFVAPLRLVPWVRTQVQSADALSSSASVVAAAFTDAAADVSNLADVADSMNRAAVAGETLAVVRRTQEQLRQVELGPSRSLIGSLAEARDRFDVELVEANELLAEVERAAAGVADFLEGPTTYLLLAANNAEMRAGSGSYLQVGLVQVNNGDVSVDELRPAGDILVERGAVSIADADLDARWGWLDMAVDWRNLSASPRFPANAAVAADMWQALEGDRVDGVMVLDPVGLATLMEVTGPVDVEGRRIEADGVIRELLFDQYWEDDVFERRDRLEEIARAALAGIETANLDFVTLAKELQDVVAARHFLAWSPDPLHQLAWETIGVSGALAPDSLSVALLNRGANKLDPFISIQAGLEARRIGDGHEVTLRLELSNAAQELFPAYVLGPAAALGHEPGSYVGLLSVNVPADATDVRFAGNASLTAEGPDGPTQVIATAVEIEAGATLTQELSFTLPDTNETLRLEPSARVPAIEWSVAGTSWTDSAAVTMDVATGDLEGRALGRTASRVSFELDPLRNPTAPLPAVAFNPATETTVEVFWQPLQDDPAVDVWERVADDPWQVVATAVTDGPVQLVDRARNTEHCYRTALSIAPDRFSAVECLTIPASLGYIQFFGDAASYFSAADLVGTGPLDLRVLVAPDRWTPDAWQMFAGQYDTAANRRAWRFGIDVFDALIANFSADGRVDVGGNGFIPPSFRDGSREWVRVTIDPEAGEQRYYTSGSGEVWSPLETRSFEPFGALYDNDGPVFVGVDRRGSDNPFAGKLYYLEVRDGIDGPVVANLDFRTLDQRDGSDGRWIDDAGNVFEATGSSWQYVPPES